MARGSTNLPFIASTDLICVCILFRPALDRCKRVKAEPIFHLNVYYANFASRKCLCSTIRGRLFTCALIAAL